MEPEYSEFDEAIPLEKPQPGWIVLLLYLGYGIGFLTVFSLGVELLIQKQVLTSAFSVTVLLLIANIFCFGGAALLVGVMLRKLSLREIGFVPACITWLWAVIAAALAIGLIPVRLVAGLVAQYILKGDFKSLNPADDRLFGDTWEPLEFLTILFLGGVLVPIAEELYFRAALYQWCRARWSIWLSTLLTSALFGLCHVSNTATMVAAFLLGIANALVYEWSKTIWAPILLHMTTNICAFCLLYLGMLLMPGAAAAIMLPF